MIALDKQAHFLSGAVIALALGYVAPAWVGFVVATTAGIAKEVYDHFNRDKHTPDMMDFVATALGGLAGAVFVFAT